MAEEKTTAKPGRRKQTAPGAEARASPQTQDAKTQEILEQARQEEKPAWEVAEQVVLLPLDKLRPFKNHPFKVQDDDELMQDTIDSIVVGGIINPILVRPMEDGQFEVVSGHRRFRASELAGLHFQNTSDRCGSSPVPAVERHRKAEAVAELGGISDEQYAPVYDDSHAYTSGFHHHECDPLRCRCSTV